MSSSSADREPVELLAEEFLARRTTGSCGKSAGAPWESFNEAEQQFLGRRVVNGKMEISRRYLAEEARDKMAREVYAADMFTATKALLHENDPYRTAEILARHIPKADETDLRCFEWYYLWNLCQRGLAAPRIDTPNSVNYVAFSHDDTFDGQFRAAAFSQALLGEAGELIGEA